ncbi:hypothetical protein RJT34_11709 [Clitoria ternatea]|uniref:Uncharacterized protein n=1 Tax=Clitoria ternatea TaxID=43366 RepID=A0AAN9PJX5_CLITE
MYTVANFQRSNKPLRFLSFPEISSSNSNQRLVQHVHYLLSPPSPLYIKPLHSPITKIFSPHNSLLWHLLLVV